MRIGAVVLGIGIIVFCLGLTIGSIEGIYESKLGVLSVILSVSVGPLFWVVGILSLITSIRKNNVDYVTKKGYIKETCRRSSKNISYPVWISGFHRTTYVVCNKPSFWYGRAVFLSNCHSRIIFWCIIFCSFRELKTKSRDKISFTS